MLFSESAVKRQLTILDWQDFVGVPQMCIITVFLCLNTSHLFILGWLEYLTSSTFSNSIYLFTHLFSFCPWDLKDIYSIPQYFNFKIYKLSIELMLTDSNIFLQRTILNLLLKKWSIKHKFILLIRLIH